MIYTDNASDIGIDYLKKYMLYSTNDIILYKKDENNRNNRNNDKKDDNKTNTFNKRMFVNYNKLDSKYNEKNIDKIQKNLFVDKLFWCFYKMLNKLSDDDMDYLNVFKTEKDFKIKIVEMVRKYSNKANNYKIKKNFLEDELLNNKKISLYTFKVLCILYKLNVFLMKDNNTYTIFDDKENDNKDRFKDYYVIRLNYNNSSILTNNFDVLFENNFKKEDIDNIVNSYYYLDDLEKPLRAISNYKSLDLINIASKLNINTNNELNKRKTKIVLYEEILKILS